MITIDNHKEPSILMFLMILSIGVLLLNSPPDIIRGYDRIKDDPKKVRKTKREMKVIGIVFTIGGTLGIIYKLLTWIFIYF